MVIVYSNVQISFDDEYFQGSDMQNFGICGTHAGNTTMS
jgi:hypothetical protein